MMTSFIFRGAVALIVGVLKFPLAFVLKKVFLRGVR